MILKALIPVFNNGVIVEEGQRFSCPSDYAEKLIENESAVEFEEESLNREQLEEKTVAELLKMAEEKGIENLSKKNKKDEIIDALMDGKQ